MIEFNLGNEEGEVKLVKTLSLLKKPSFACVIKYPCCAVSLNWCNSLGLSKNL